MNILRITLKILFFPVRTALMAVSILSALLAGPLAVIGKILRIAGIIIIIMTFVIASMVYPAYSSDEITAMLAVVDPSLAVHTPISVIIYSIVLSLITGGMLIASARLFPWICGKICEWLARLAGFLRFDARSEEDS